MKISLKVCQYIALIGSVVTAVQIFLLLIGDEGICFNNGCKIVDSFTIISPLFVNAGGFVFFQVAFWGFKQAKGEGWLLSLLRLFLFGALAAEAVLFSFQLFVAGVFCSYCLIVLTFIVLLNLFSGIRHLLIGISVFASVMVGFSILQFEEPVGDLLDKLDAGVYASLENGGNAKRYLFFSSTCVHCEKIIESLEGGICSVSFNPVDTVGDFFLKDAVISERYDATINRRLLKSLGIDQVPLLLEQIGPEFKIITGSDTISDYFNGCCRGVSQQQQKFGVPGAVDSAAEQSSSGEQSPSRIDINTFTLPPKDDTCSLYETCD